MSRTPILTSRSTTAGGRLGTAPEDLDRRPLLLRDAQARPSTGPAEDHAGSIRSISFRFARSRPGTDGYRGRLRPSLTDTTAGNGTS